MTRARTTTVGAVVLTLLSLGACTGGGGEPEPEPSEDRPEKLKELWSHPAAHAVGSGPMRAWHGDGVVALPDFSVASGEPGGMRGYDADTGRKRWQWKPPKGTQAICDMSPEPNADGVGGLVLQSQDGDCDRAAAVDVGSGKILWTTDLGAAYEEQREGNAVSVGGGSLAVTVECDEVRRLGIGNGKPLDTLARRDEDCRHDADHDSRYVAVLDNPDEPLTDDLPSGQGGAAFVLYDAEPGEKSEQKPERQEPAKAEEMWRHPTARLGTELHRIIAHDPLTLDVTERGQRYVRTYDKDGKQLHRIGKELPDNVMTLPRVADGVLVNSYVKDPHLYAYDLRTGKKLWTWDATNRHVVGIDGRDGRQRLLTTRTVAPEKSGSTDGTDGTDGKANELWLETTAPREGKEQGARKILGRVTGATSGLRTTTVHDGRLYIRDRDAKGKPRVSAYALPEKGSPDTYRADAPGPEVTGWSEGDFRPDRAARTCEAVDTRTRGMMNLEGDRPPPANCVWQEHYEPRDTERELRVSVTAHPPETGAADGKGTAAKAAQDAYRKAAQDDDFSGAQTVSGLGDEATYAEDAAVGGMETEVRLLIRHRNALVRITAKAEGSGPATAEAVPPPHRLRSAVRSAAVDVLNTLDTDSALNRQHPTGGPVSDARGLCAAVSAEGTRAVPGAQIADTSYAKGADKRSVSCHWDTGDGYGPTLSVRATALPNHPLTGERATDLAKRVLRRWADDKDRTRIDGIGDGAVLDRFSFEKGRHRDHTLLVRKDNLLLVVSYDKWHHPSAQQLDATVERVARKALAASEQ